LRLLEGDVRALPVRASGRGGEVELINVDGLFPKRADVRGDETVRFKSDTGAGPAAPGGAFLNGLVGNT